MMRLLIDAFNCVAQQAFILEGVIKKFWGFEATLLVQRDNVSRG